MPGTLLSRGHLHEAAAGGRLHFVPNASVLHEDDRGHDSPVE